MKNLPSKELLSEVLPFGDINSLISYGLISDVDILLQYEDIDEIFSIYELAHKCKEWAYRQGYVLLSGYSAYGVGLFFCSCKGWLSENYDKQIEITHNTEPEAIFKATSYIMEQLKQ